MIKDFLKRYWWRYLIGVVFLIAVDGLMLVVPRILGNIVDDLRNGLTDLSVVGVALFAIIGVAFGLFVSRFMWRVFIMGAARKFEYYSKKTLFEKLLDLPASFYDKTRVGDLMARFTNDVNAMRMAMGPAIVMAVDSTFLIVVTLLAMGNFVSWRLTWIAFIPFPLLAVISTFFGKIIHKRFKAVQSSFSNLTDTVEESIAGIRLIKSYGIEDLRSRTLSDKSMDYVDKNMSLIRIWGMFFPLLMTLSTVGNVLAIYFGGKGVILGEITLGEFITFISYLGMLTWPMMAFGWIINIIQRGRASYKRLMEIMDSESDVITEQPVQVNGIKGNIVFDNLTFTYPTGKEPALKNISLDINPGSKVAFVGTTGSGKSTIAKLIARLYQVDSGRITVDGTDLNSLKPKIIRNDIAYVPQETFLFSETIKNNITFGIDKASDEEIVNFASIAAIKKDIESFPEKYETMVGERGVTLSGGQKQRIAIARALIKNSPVVILDDCLSAVDTETEARILESLRSNEDKSRTVIIISHRLKAVMDSDAIYVMHDGEIIERGTHEDLLKENGLYKKMYDRQMLEEKLEEE